MGRVVAQRRQAAARDTATPRLAARRPRRIKAGSYSEKDARRLVREMARAVAQCHGMNVMLRDIKPENVRPGRAGLGGWLRAGALWAGGPGGSWAPGPQAAGAGAPLSPAGVPPAPSSACTAPPAYPPAHTVYVPGRLARRPAQGH